MELTQWMHLTFILFFGSLRFACVKAGPVVACPPNTANQYGNYYISDTDINARCLFYWCQYGRLIPVTFQCGGGNGTVYQSHGPTSICTQQLVECGYSPPSTPSLTTPSPTTPLPTTPSPTTPSPTTPAPTTPAPTQPAPTPTASRTTTLPGHTTPSSITSTTKPNGGTTKPNGGRVALVLLRGMHLHGGTVQDTVPNFLLCLIGCVTNPVCLGFDFNTRAKSCWFHNVTSVCNTPVPKTYCSHYKFYSCEVTTTTTHSPTTPLGVTTVQPGVTTVQPGVTTIQPGLTTVQPGGTTIQPGFTTVQPDVTTVQPDVTTVGQVTTAVISVMEFPGRHIGDATKKPDIRNLQLCLDTCQLDPDCEGVDFDSRDLTCWFHTNATECNEFRVKAGCTHFRLKAQCGAPATTPTPAPSTAVPPTSPPVTSLPPTPTQPPTTLSPSAVPNGYLSVIMDSHLMGGTLMLATVTLQQCLHGCLVNSYCLAVDYDAIAQTCYGFGMKNYCGMLEPMPETTHYMRVPCIDGTPNDLTETRYKFHLSGGALVCTGCSREQCLETCFSGKLCEGVDYDERYMACFIHTSLSVCGALIAKDHCTHYSRASCPLLRTRFMNDLANDAGGDDDGTTPRNMVVFNQGFIEINYAGPAILFPGWQAYPGMHVQGGKKIGEDMTGDDCLKRCFSDHTCQSVDYNSYDGSCFVFSSQTKKCATLMAANLVFHAKKPPRCSDPNYPTPIDEAPAFK